jgi:hypothetical protein
LNLPTFDGANTKLWLSRCVDYFELYEVEQSRWIMVSTMHFVPPAAHWLPSVEYKLKSCSRLQFSSMLLDRFGRDQHEVLIRQLLNIKQLGSVNEYIDKFASLLDQLAAYEGTTNPLHHTMRFIDGLKDELKSSVLIQRPQDLDTAYTLAQLQKELYDISGKKRDFKKVDSYSSKPYFKTVVTAPAPAFKQNRNAGPSSEDRRMTESARASSTDDKWRSLKAFREAKGLCQYCAENGSKTKSVLTTSS